MVVCGDTMAIAAVNSGAFSGIEAGRRQRTNYGWIYISSIGMYW
jgi:hypothetical protein